jgi:hypothetical protein
MVFSATIRLASRKQGWNIGRLDLKKRKEDYNLRELSRYLPA